LGITRLAGTIKKTPEAGIVTAFGKNSGLDDSNQAMPYIYRYDKDSGRDGHAPYNVFFHKSLRETGSTPVVGSSSRRMGG